MCWSQVHDGKKIICNNMVRIRWFVAHDTQMPCLPTLRYTCSVSWSNCGMVQKNVSTTREWYHQYQDQYTSQCMRHMTKRFFHWSYYVILPYFLVDMLHMQFGLGLWISSSQHVPLHYQKNHYITKKTCQMEPCCVVQLWRYCDCEFCFGCCLFGLPRDTKRCKTLVHYHSYKMICHHKSHVWMAHPPHWIHAQSKNCRKRARRTQMTYYTANPK